MTTKVSLPDVTVIDPFGVRIQGHSCARPDDLPIATLRDLARIHHLVVLRNFAGFRDAEDLAAWCDEWGLVTSSPFGSVLDLIENENPTSPMSTSYVPFHWDGMYKPYVPEFQILQCVRSSEYDQGGRTTFCNTSALLEDLDPATAEAWRNITVTYRMQNVLNSGGQAVSPLIMPHPRTGVLTLRYYEPSPSEIPGLPNQVLRQFDGIDAERVPDLLIQLRKALYDPWHFYGHEWQEGDVVIADNYTLLHGHEALTGSTPRHLRRVHVLGQPPFQNPAIV